MIFLSERCKGPKKTLEYDEIVRYVHCVVITLQNSESYTNKGEIYY